MALVPCSLGIGLLAAGDMENNFINPPDSARPGVYGYFMDGNLNGKKMQDHRGENRGGYWKGINE